MKPGIKQYLDEHGATYTPEALRKGLLDAGYDPAEVDAALGGWNALAKDEAGAQEGRRFRRLALGLHTLALVTVFVVLVALKGIDAAGVALLGCAVLGVALLIGWAISSLIGRALLRGTGMTIALIVPALSALALGGTCFALLNAAIPTPATDGTVRLTITSPVAFEGSAAAACYLRGDVQVRSHDLGTLDGRNVTLDIYWYPAGQGPAEVVDLLITVGTEFDAAYYGQIPTTQLTVDAAEDGRSGTIQFEGLAREAQGPDDTDLELTGSATWTCE